MTKSKNVKNVVLLCDLINSTHMNHFSLCASDAAKTLEQLLLPQLTPEIKIHPDWLIAYIPSKDFCELQFGQ